MFPILNRISTGVTAGGKAGLSSYSAKRKMVLAVGCSRWLVICMLLKITSASAQEALRNMQAGITAADARNQQMQSPAEDYVAKWGDFRLALVPSMGVAYNDNVNLSQTNVLDDYIVTPGIDVKASYPLSKRSLLYLDVTVGYNWYLKNSQFSSFYLNSSSGTGLSFDIAVKDVTFNLHNWITYSQGVGDNAVTTGPTSGLANNSVNGSIANTATYGTFQNTAGLSATWDLNQVTLSAGYDHQNVLATSSEFNYLNHSAELLFARAGLQINPRTTAGLEATAAFTSYQQAVLNDNNAYTVGPYIEFRPGSFFSIIARGGYTIYNFQNTSATIQTANQNSWYGELILAHQPTESVSYSLQAGREVQLGVVSDLLQDWYVRPNLTLSIIKGLDISTSAFFEHGTEGVGSVGSVPGNSNGTYNWYGGGISLQHEFTSRLALALLYRITVRSSEIPNTSYLQNVIALQLTYHPKSKSK
jgi:hypothetical protein